MMPLLDPSGPIGATEKLVILTAVGLMLIVVVPVFVLTFLFAWRYRASNSKAVYAPDWAHSRKIEIVVWLVPALIVAALATLTWETTHELNPYTAIDPAGKPLPVEAVAMDWKWLFIYPRQHIATVNDLVVPKGVPVSFRLTSDSVLTSFFVPRLGTQIYAMPGMETRLHLLSSKTGSFTGRNYAYSGRGYSWMKFNVTSTTKKGFRDWVQSVRRSPQRLNLTALAKLERPSIAVPASYYSGASPSLFDTIIRDVRTDRRAVPRHSAPAVRQPAGSSWKGA